MGRKFNPGRREFEFLANWGEIEGTLSDQLDLQIALDGKSDVGHTHIAADITDFDIEVGNHIDVAANTAARHTQNTDIKLDDGQPNEVTAADLRIHLDDVTTNPHNVTAALTSTDITNFGPHLSAADDTVQKALETLEISIHSLHEAVVVNYQPDQSHNYGDYRAHNISAAGNSNLTFKIPDDFLSLVSLKVFFIPASTIAVGKTLDLNSDYAAAGELSDTHSESAIDFTITGTANTIEQVDISGIFTSIAAGDFCGFNWKNNTIGTTISILTIEMIYNQNE